MKKLFKRILLFSCIITFSLNVFSQNTFKVKGIIVDPSGETLIGVTIVEKGITNATLTNDKGEYELSTSSPTTTLIYSYLGSKSQEQKLNNRSTINVTMDDNQVTLGDVVVTALGISREKKALGYAVQDD